VSASRSEAVGAEDARASATAVRVLGGRSLEARALAALLAEHGLQPVDGDEADVVVVASPRRVGGDRVRHLVGALDPRARSAVVGPEDDGALLEAVVAGADGYAAWTQAGAAIAAAVDRVAAGEAVIPPGMLGGLLRGLIHRRREASDVEERFRSLSEREREVLVLLCHGRDATAVAGSLQLSIQTVRSHIQRLLGKFEVRSQLQVVSLVLDHGLVDPSAGGVEVRR
jgi:DNA-binding NarL/FixJ family response regulator